MEDSLEAVDPRAELRSEALAIVGALRAHLEARGRGSVVGVSRAPSPRFAEEVSAEIEPPVVAPPGLPAAAFAGGCQTPLDEPAGDEPVGLLGLRAVREALGDCQRCRLASGRRQIVFGTGNPEAALVFVGEAPGADEDAQGEPFVGKAGQLLTKMIEAMGYARSDVYICNVIKCRPPGNRNPEPDEVAACEPFLKRQLAALRPRLIVALGKFAAQSLCRETTPITRLRGNLRSYEGIPVMPTYHPAYLLRNPASKREAWADLQAVTAALARVGVHPPARR